MKKSKEHLEENLVIVDKLTTLVNRFPGKSFGEILFHFMTPENTITMGDLLHQSNQVFINTMDKFLGKKKKQDESNSVITGTNEISNT